MLLCRIVAAGHVQSGSRFVQRDHKESLRIAWAFLFYLFFY